ncbi:MAG: HAD family phosphatase [Phycisphaerae bacterium]|nr:HAD family phosphatase [Phycisphaerae bacterium]
MDALIFDFDGVIVDSEPVHFATFQEILNREGINMSRDDYYDKYLGFDDRDCFKAVAADNQTAFTDAKVRQLTEAKTQLVRKAFQTSVRALGGAVELIRQTASGNLPMAICSGSLRQEILLASEAIGVRDCFQVIVSAEDVHRGKPDPEGYRLALLQLSRYAPDGPEPGRTVVIEDSPAGIEAAGALGMKVLAVSTSYPASELTTADRVVASLTEVTHADLEEMVRPRT